MSENHSDEETHSTAFAAASPPRRTPARFANALSSSGQDAGAALAAISARSPSVTRRFPTPGSSSAPMPAASCSSLAALEEQLGADPLAPSGGYEARRMVLELADGVAYAGFGFGAEGKSVSGECVFQTGPWVSRRLVLTAQA